MKKVHTCLFCDRTLTEKAMPIVIDWTNPVQYEGEEGIHTERERIDFCSVECLARITWDGVTFNLEIGPGEPPEWLTYASPDGLLTGLVPWWRPQCLPVGTRLPLGYSKSTGFVELPECFAGRLGTRPAQQAHEPSQAQELSECLISRMGGSWCRAHNLPKRDDLDDEAPRPEGLSHVLENPENPPSPPTFVQARAQFLPRHVVGNPTRSVRETPGMSARIMAASRF
jgi:hypothetical protein